MNCNFEIQIECLRNQLIEVAQHEGMHSERTIILSRELDLLINEYERQKEKSFEKICNLCLYIRKGGII